MANRPVQIQMSVPFTDMVKKLVIANAVIYVVCQVILDAYFLDGMFFRYLSFVPPQNPEMSFWPWQIVTYMFLHSPTSWFHVVFNMLMLWWMGSELEMRWGPKFFLTYYLVCGVGAILIHLIGGSIYWAITGNLNWTGPVIGASGAVFGLMVAYGIIFGERTVYFMMIFPMQAKYFVLILGAIQVITLLQVGMASNVANLAHLGGIIAGFLFLVLWTRLQRGQWKKSSTKKRSRNLKLVVNNDDDDDSGPRYWN